MQTAIGRRTYKILRNDLHETRVFKRMRIDRRRWKSLRIHLPKIESISLQFIKLSNLTIVAFNL